MQALLSQACKRQPSPGEAVAESAPGAGPARFCNGARLVPAKDWLSWGRAACIIPWDAWRLELDWWEGMRWGATPQQPGAGFGGWIFDEADGHPVAGLSCSRDTASCIALEGGKKKQKSGLQCALAHECALQLPELPRCWWWHPQCLHSRSGQGEPLWDSSGAADPLPDPGERQTRSSQARWDCPGSRDLCRD